MTTVWKSYWPDPRPPTAAPAYQFHPCTRVMRPASVVHPRIPSATPPRSVLVLRSIVRLAHWLASSPTRVAVTVYGPDVGADRWMTPLPLSATPPNVPPGLG